MELNASTTCAQPVSEMAAAVSAATAATRARRGSRIDMGASFEDGVDEEEGPAAVSGDRRRWYVHHRMGTIGRIGRICGTLAVVFTSSCGS
jgi:hypothetical protein